MRRVVRSARRSDDVVCEDDGFGRVGYVDDGLRGRSRGEQRRKSGERVPERHLDDVFHFLRLVRQEQKSSNTFGISRWAGRVRCISAPTLHFCDEVRVDPPLRIGAR
jgi:hypothetical protein